MYTLSICTWYLQLMKGRVLKDAWHESNQIDLWSICSFTKADCHSDQGFWCQLESTTCWCLASKPPNGDGLDRMSWGCQNLKYYAVCLSMSLLMHPLLNSLSGRCLTWCITHHMLRVNYFLPWRSCSTMCSNLPSTNHSITNTQASNT